IFLLANALANGCAHASVEGRHVGQTALLPGHEHLEQIVGTRQAAAVGGQDTVRASLHRQPPYRNTGPAPERRCWTRMVLAMGARSTRPRGGRSIHGETSGLRREPASPQGLQIVPPWLRRGV